MKKNLLTRIGLALLIMSGLSAQAQHYQPFRKGPTYHFLAQDSIYSLRVDSVKVMGGDSVFVFNPMVKKKMETVAVPGCTPASVTSNYRVQANNQFGKKVRKQANGDYIFSAAQGHDFLLKTKAAVGQTWTFNTNQNITATLTAKTQEPVLNQTDSVQVIALSNGKTIKLSKNFGLVKAPNFVSYADPDFPAKELDFYALPEKGLGHTISSAFAIFNFLPGDEFLYYAQSYDGSSFGSLCTEVWTQRRILSRSLSAGGDTIYYQVEEQSLTKGYGSAGAPQNWCQVPTGTTLGNLVTYTMPVFKDKDSITNVLSGGYLPRFAYSGRVLTGLYRNAQYNQREQMAAIGLGYEKCPKAFMPLIHGGGSFRYAVGLGQVYGLGATAGYGYGTSTLVAYKKGSETYGTWRTVAQIMGAKEDLKQNPLVKAYPNPFTSELTLTFGETSGTTQLTLRNALGQLVWQQETIAAAPNSEVKVKLPELAKGLYILQASQNGRIYTSRLMKE